MTSMIHSAEIMENSLVFLLYFWEITMSKNKITMVGFIIHSLYWIQ